MSEVSKFDLSRIKISNATGKLKLNEIVLPKTNILSSVKADAIDTQKSYVPTSVQTDEVVDKQTNSPDTVQTDEVTDKETNSANTIKTDEIVDKKINRANTVKTDEIVNKETNSSDAVKTDELVDKETNTGDTVKANEVDSEKTSVSGEQKNLAETAKEIQELLAPLKAIYPTNSEYEKQVFVNKFREEIRRNSHVQEVLIAGKIELIKIICQPLDIPIHMGKKWLETAKRNQ